MCLVTVCEGVWSLFTSHRIEMAHAVGISILQDCLRGPCSVNKYFQPFIAQKATSTTLMFNCCWHCILLLPFPTAILPLFWTRHNTIIYYTRKCDVHMHVLLSHVTVHVGISPISRRSTDPMTDFRMHFPFHDLIKWHWQHLVDKIICQTLTSPS